MPLAQTDSLRSAATSGHPAIIKCLRMRFLPQQIKREQTGRFGCLRLRLAGKQRRTPVCEFSLWESAE